LVVRFERSIVAPKLITVLVDGVVEVVVSTKNFGATWMVLSEVATTAISTLTAITAAAVTGTQGTT
jgi:hypothetical protein